MPMELLSMLATSELPMTVESSADIDKLRLLAAARLIEARLPEVGAGNQTAQVLTITQKGHAALAREFPQRRRPAQPKAPAQPSSAPDWLPSLDSLRVERDSTRTTLDS